jgi:hypothetical protein
MALARAKGKLRGNNPSSHPSNSANSCAWAGTGEYTIADLAELFTVSRTTVSRTLQRDTVQQAGLEST